MENICQTFRDNADQEILFFYSIFFSIPSLFYKGLNNGRATTPAKWHEASFFIGHSLRLTSNYRRYVDFGCKAVQ